MKIVFPDEATVALNDDMDFSALGLLGTYTSYPNSTEDEIIERSQSADVIVANKIPMTRRVIESLPNLKLIAVIATGYNNVDIVAAKEHNIRVCNVAGYALHTVPQHTFALILNLATKVHLYHNDVQAGNWSKASSFCLLNYPVFELAGKTIGIIGFGTIGRGVARIAEGFGMKILAYDAFEIKDSVYSNTDLETVLAESDIVTLHCPLTDETKNMINAETFTKMKSTALLINTARGGLADEQAVVDALNNGQLGGAGFDVLTTEPPKDGNVLIGAKNMIVTPHSAWSSREARQALVDGAAANIKSFIEGKSRNVVA